tara:strand:- start:1167 stop:1535 length:369 start_codon:yes stop_codon:yes gene_type:complete
MFHPIFASYYLTECFDLVGYQSIHQNFNMIIEVHTKDDIKNIVVDAVRDALANFQPVKVSTPDDFLTKEDVAAMLKMSKSGIDSLRRRGLLKPYRIGASVRFKRSEIMTMLNSTNGRKQEAA